ncbi:MAG: hypothetical protein QXS74_06370 [Nitrososphaeria archaeon]
MEFVVGENRDMLSSQKPRLEDGQHLVKFREVRLVETKYGERLLWIFENDKGEAVAFTSVPAKGVCSPRSKTYEFYTSIVGKTLQPGTKISFKDLPEITKDKMYTIKVDKGFVKTVLMVPTQK